MKAVVEHRGCTFALDDDTKQHIIAAARWLIDSHTPPGLLLCGLCGNGKTSLAKAIAWLIGYITEHENGYSNRKYMRLHTAKAICHSFGTQDYEGICNSEMIIIDDLGEEPKEVLKYGQPETPIIDLLNERYVHQRITVITSNLETDALRAKYGERVYDRLREMVTSVVFENDSYRGRK
jgi:DNA replication protein DnaC